jgi:hypothetical protein
MNRNFPQYISERSAIKTASEIRALQTCGEPQKAQRLTECSYLMRGILSIH